MSVSLPEILTGAHVALCRDPTDLQTMVFGIPLVSGFRTRMLDPHVYAVSGPVIKFISINLKVMAW